VRRGAGTSKVSRVGQQPSVSMVQINSADVWRHIALSWG
jgi:hypothetical protein